MWLNDEASIVYMPSMHVSDVILILVKSCGSGDEASMPACMYMYCKWRCHVMWLNEVVFVQCNY